MKSAHIASQNLQRFRKINKIGWLLNCNPMTLGYLKTRAGWLDMVCEINIPNLIQDDNKVPTTRSIGLKSPDTPT